jgi:hypothetical protein
MLKAQHALIAFGLTLGCAALAAPLTVDEVGDPDSFGRNVIYLGLRQTSSVVLRTSCNPPLPVPATTRCITLNSQPLQTDFNEQELGSIELPSGATRSLLCFALTPMFSFQFNNLTSARQPDARFLTRAVITIKNEVLNDPTLVDPSTGQPFNGLLILRLVTYEESRSIDAGERASKSMSLSRGCLAGFVSRQALLYYGLSETQADQFFAVPMTLTFGVLGSVKLVDEASYHYGVRLYGDL